MEQQQQQQQLIIVICMLLINLNQITVTIADNDLSENYNDIVYNNNGSYNNNNNNIYINNYYISDERYSVLRLRTNDLNQFLSVKKLIDSSVDLKVSNFFFFFISFSILLLMT